MKEDAARLRYFEEKRYEYLPPNTRVEKKFLRKFNESKSRGRFSLIKGIFTSNSGTIAVVQPFISVCRSVVKVIFISTLKHSGKYTYQLL